MNAFLPFVGFGEPGPLEYLPIGAVVLIMVGLLARNSRGFAPTLVLQRFIVNESGSNGLVVQIVGRREGIIAAILTAIGLDVRTTFNVTTGEVAFSTASLSGQVHRTVPLANVSSTHCGYSKPIGLLLAAVLFFIAGLAVSRENEFALIIGLVVGLICLVAYFLKKTMSLSIETTGGTYLALAFKGSVLEGTTVNIAAVMHAIRLINHYVLAAQGRVLPV